MTYSLAGLSLSATRISSALVTREKRAALLAAPLRVTRRVLNVRLAFIAAVLRAEAANFNFFFLIATIGFCHKLSHWAKPYFGFRATACKKPE